MKLNLLIILTLLASLSSCSKKKSSNQNLMESGKIPDFEAQEAPTFPALKITDCRGNIKDIVCIVNPAKDGNYKAKRECIGDNSEYIETFEKIFDNYPKPLQQMFCSIRIILIEKEFFATAYASNAKDKEGNITGAVLGIRKSVIDQSLDLSQWASWKEQLSFGGVTDSYSSSSSLPEIITTSKTKANDFLYFVIAHEFGHFFDYANTINQFDECSGDQYKCPASKGSWTDLSWDHEYRINDANFFSYAPALCFYNCKDNYISISNVNNIYTDMFATNFISSYAASNPWDDFAESIAYYVMDKYLQTNYILKTNQGLEFDVIKSLHSRQFDQKYKFVDKFLNGNKIKYPGIQYN